MTEQGTQILESFVPLPNMLNKPVAFQSSHKLVDNSKNPVPIFMKRPEHVYGVKYKILGKFHEN